ncbi:MucB/RseB C-terminal domain-containing protein [Motilimonas eburnea]|uniref:MucB/RseB C-terminal domain-containing protein n=1 Tax=Motilimonas eburnea TaxID=1737488 RepID=UPI001E60A01D|nr:MucB/RseB C-terminal domain-containing protein [Motilimonas eburnea]MCE2571439.1 MucB/RseB C-terminal domain-containing protein [Motilimonas eburnea]
MHFYRITPYSSVCCNKTKFTQSTQAILLACVLALFCIRSWAAPSEPHPPANQSTEFFLQQMANSFAELNYDLSYIQVFEGVIEPKRLSHGVLDGLEISYLSHLNGPPTEYVQRGKQVSFFEPDIEPYTLETELQQGSLFRIAKQDLAQLQLSYDFVQAGKSRVAGRPAQVIRMSPKDGDRYGYLIWLDRHTSLPLRIDTLDLQGQLVEQMMAISLRLYNEATPWIAELSSVDLPAVVTVNKSAANSVAWQLSWLPKGFQVVSSDSHSIPITGDAVDYFMASDGVAMVSVYIEPDEQPMASLTPVARKGAINLITVKHRGNKITVVGDIPTETGLKIARSVMATGNNKAKGKGNNHG